MKTKTFTSVQKDPGTQSWADFSVLSPSQTVNVPAQVFLDWGMKRNVTSFILSRGETNSQELRKRELALKKNEVKKSEWDEWREQH